MTLVYIVSIAVIVLLQSAHGFAIPPARRLGGSSKLQRQPTTTKPLSVGDQRLLGLRGGALHVNPLDGVQTISPWVKFPAQIVSSINNNPALLFNSIVFAFVSGSFAWKLFDSRPKMDGEVDAKPAAVKSLQIRFLTVFWLLRMADWLQGPYFYEVYSSKVLNGAPVSLALVSQLFLVGFASTGIFGPWMGRFVDTVGRKAGTLLYTLLYALGALSTRSNSLAGLLAGRVAGGLGTSLLFSAPEAWLVGDHQKQKLDGKWLGETFGLAYAGDSLVAILAGQLASWSVASVGGGGPTGPFLLSVGFLLAAAALIIPLWSENTASATKTDTPVAPLTDTPSSVDAAATSVKKSASTSSISDAIAIMKADKRILLLGAVQALFEGAMYIFVLQWPPAMQAAFSQQIALGSFAKNTAVPYGNIFSTFMASCLLGSTIFGKLQQRRSEQSSDKTLTTETTASPTKRGWFGRWTSAMTVEKSTLLMLSVATLAMSIAATFGLHNLWFLIPAFLVFEVCVGMYFPSIGTLRSKYLPDSHRSVIMNLFGIPLNLLVVSVFLSIKQLGTVGALACATTALGVAAVCMSRLCASPDQRTPAKDEI